ncbi:MAG: AmmeMemoRadiSam system protein B [Ignavibacteriae bacterium]|nr:MAG: AmmeMemoRadiSam system protein B [Ignavibacteriota bacterium]
MNFIREPKVAGMFYPAEADELEKLIYHLLAQVNLKEKYNSVKGLISPHAGYVYSGQTAAYAYSTIRDKSYENVIVISPSHREYFDGISIYDGDAYKTPLGIIPVNKNLRDEFIKQSNIIFTSTKGHGAEHALEVQLPFLQVVQSNFKIIPIVIGAQNHKNIFGLADALFNTIDDETLIVVSSDLSHFYSKEEALNLDSLVIEYIDHMDYKTLEHDLELKKCEACGGGGIVALLKTMNEKKNIKAKVLEYCDSGDVSGDSEEVVGYLSAVLYE